MLYNAYEYNRVVASIQNFVANQVSSIYVHLIKDRLYCGNSHELQDIRCTLSHCYRQLCKALWPIAPYLIEESWSYYEPTGSAFHEETVQADKDWRNVQATQIVNAALDIKRIVNQQAGDVNSWHLSVGIKCCSLQQLEMLTALHGKLDVPIANTELCEILQVGSATVESQLDSSVDTALVRLQTLDSSLCPRCRRFTIVQQDICGRCSEILSTKN